MYGPTHTLCPRPLRFISNRSMDAAVSSTIATKSQCVLMLEPFILTAVGINTNLVETAHEHYEKRKTIQHVAFSTHAAEKQCVVQKEGNTDVTDFMMWLIRVNLCCDKRNLRALRNHHHLQWQHCPLRQRSRLLQPLQQQQLWRPHFHQLPPPQIAAMLIHAMELSFAIMWVWDYRIHVETTIS